MIKMSPRLVFMVPISFLMGCSSTIDSFYNRHVVEDQLVTSHTREQEIGTVAVTAQRRLIIANLKTGSFCSEPPPEVADSISSAIAMALEANISKGKEVNAELASNFARHVNQLYKRAHTVQLFRDASYHLCVNSVNTANGRSSYESYKDDLKHMMDSVLPILEKEVTAYYEVEKERAKNPPPTYQDIILCNSGAGIDRANDESAKKLSTSVVCRPITNEKKQDIQKEKEEVKSTS
ncbi:hypothetical protein NB493_08925 [Vibrio alginolyticus]|nr:hypothetical protein [Vibrio alginolyticus]